MAKVIEVVVYEAADGSRFDSAAAADAHDFKLANGEKITKYTENFLNATGAIDRSRNMQKNTIEAFLSYHLAAIEAGTVEDAVERTVFDTPKEDKAVEVAADAAAEAAVAAEGEQPAEEPVF